MAIPNEMIDRPNLKPKEVCEILGVGIEAVLGWIRSGDLEASNIGQGSRPRWIIQRSSIDAFLQARSNKSEAKGAKPSKRRPRSKRRFL